MNDKYPLISQPMGEVPRELWPVMFAQWDAFHAELEAENRAYKPKFQMSRGKVHVVGDLMDNLKHPLTGKYTDSKSAFRRMTKENGGIEIGNEDEVAVSIRAAKAEAEAHREDVRQTLQRVRQMRG